MELASALIASTSPAHAAEIAIRQGRATNQAREETARANQGREESHEWRKLGGKI